MLWSRRSQNLKKIFGNAKQGIQTPEDDLWVEGIGEWADEEGSGEAAQLEQAPHERHLLVKRSSLASGQSFSVSKAA